MVADELETKTVRVPWGAWLPTVDKMVQEGWEIVKSAGIDADAGCDLVVFRRRKATS